MIANQKNPNHWFWSKYLRTCKG